MIQLLFQLLAYQAVRVENLLLKNGNLNYDDLVTITKDDFIYFTENDFINIIGSEKVKLYK